MREEEKVHPLNSDSLFEKLHDCHTECMEDIPDIPLSEMERLDDEMFAALEAAELEDVMAMEEESEDIFRPMYEVDIDEKYERMSSESNFTFVQNCRSAEGINLRNCVLLDSESTVHAFCNRNLVERVWAASDSMTLVSNGGEITTSMMCQIKNLAPQQPVWFHPEYITNVLSLALLKKQFKITYDSTKGGSFEVHRPDGKNMFFHC